MAQAPTCWARGTEIEELLQPVLARQNRSAVLLHGDSGIGKSTLMREVRARLTLPGVIIGYHETSQADSDPLLRTLDDLLKQVYSISGSSKQIRIACEKAKSFVSVSGLKDFLIATLKAVGDSGGLGPFAKGVTSFFGWAADKATGLDAAVPAGLVPKLGVDAFTDILTLLQTALPQEQLVFLVDNLSAPAEAVTAEIRGFSTLDTIQAYLSQGFSAAQGVHFLFSWKLTDQTQSAFRALSVTLHQYKGLLKPLAPIQEGRELANWLNHEFAWFRDLDKTHQRHVVDLTGGLPEIVVQWRESGITSANLDQLKAVAEDTRNGRFQSLRDALENAPANAAAVLYGLALAHHPMPVSSLSPMLDCVPQTCLDALRSWEQRRLLRSRIDASDPLPAYQYDHEHKLAIALDVLPASFADGGELLQRRAYLFFLSHFTLARFDRPTGQNPCSALYLLDAIALLSHSRFLTEESQSRPHLEAAIQMAMLGEKPAQPPILDWGFLPAWPHSFQGWFLDLCLATSYSSTQSILDAAEIWLSQPPPSSGNLGLAFAEASACANLAGRMRGQNRPHLLAHLLDRLFILQQQFPKSILLARQVGMAIVNAIAIASDAPDSEEVPALLLRLNEIASRFQADPELGHIRMKAIINANNQKLSEVLDELKAIQARFPDDRSIALDLGSAIADSMQDSFLEHLRLLAVRFPQEPMCRHLAKGIANALMTPARLKQDEPVTLLLNELLALQQAAPADLETAVQSARGLAISIMGSVNASQASTRAAQLIQLHLQFHDNPDITRIMAQGAINAAARLAEWQEYATIVEFANITRALAAASPDDPWLQSRHAEILAVIIAAHATDGSAKTVDNLLLEVKELRRQTSDFDVQFQCARAFAKASMVYGNRLQMQELRSVLKWLRGLTEDWPQSRQMAGQLAWGVFNSMLAHLNSPDDTERNSLQRELQSLEARFPKLHMGDPI